MASELASKSLAELYALFFDAQERRPFVYAEFSTAFEGYLEHNELSLFQEASAKITKDFQDISTQIVNIENEFKARNVSSTAALIRRLQNKERELLQITVGIQVVTKSIQDVEEDDFDVDEMKASVKEKRTERGSIIEAINDILDEIMEERHAL